MPDSDRVDYLNRYFPVLDHGFVALVDSMGGDHSVVRAARCSYGDGTRAVSSDKTLLRYLMRHDHTGPFEMVELVFHMRLPIFVARQIVRTRTASLNEYSGRYSEMPMQFYTPVSGELRRQSSANKQGSGEQLDDDTCLAIADRWQATRDSARQAYRFGLDEGLAREIARIELPLSTYTEWYWKIDLHNLFRFLGLRLPDNAQSQTRAYARVMAGLTQVVAPLCFEAFELYKLYAVTFSLPEMVSLLAAINKDAAEYGARFLSKRERKEFAAKLSGNDNSRLNFNLDLGAAQGAEYFHARRDAACVP